MDGLASSTIARFFRGFAIAAAIGGLSLTATPLAAHADGDQPVVGGFGVCDSSQGVTVDVVDVTDENWQFQGATLGATAGTTKGETTTGITLTGRRAFATYFFKKPVLPSEITQIAARFTGSGAGLPFVNLQYTPRSIPDLDANLRPSPSGGNQWEAASSLSDLGWTGATSDGHAIGTLEDFAKLKSLKIYGVAIRTAEADTQASWTTAGISINCKGYSFKKAELTPPTKDSVKVIETPSKLPQVKAPDLPGFKYVFTLDDHEPLVVGRGQQALVPAAGTWKVTAVPLDTINTTVNGVTPTEVDLGTITVDPQIDLALTASDITADNGTENGSVKLSLTNPTGQLLAGTLTVRDTQDTTKDPLFIKGKIQPAGLEETLKNLPAGTYSAQVTVDAFLGIKSNTLNFTILPSTLRDDEYGVTYEILDNTNLGFAGTDTPKAGPNGTVIATVTNKAKVPLSYLVAVRERPADPPRKRSKITFASAPTSVLQPGASQKVVLTGVPTGDLALVVRPYEIFTKWREFITIADAKPGTIAPQGTAQVGTKLSASGSLPKSLWGEKTELRLFSQPTKLGPVTLDANGNWKASALIPTSVKAGAHRLAVVGSYNRILASVPLQVAKQGATDGTGSPDRSGKSHPVTGIDPTATSLAALGLLLLGIGVFGLTRRRA